jgi:cytochrome c-type biogenesis protein CcmF
VWNLSLITATFSLTVLGTFLTRSGVIESVHSFSESDIGPLLLGFFACVVVVGVGLIAWRGDRLRAPGGIDASVSREGAFLLNNLLFAALAFVVLLGTVFPLLYEALDGQQVTVGAPYFDAMTLPIALALLLLMAVGPALPWRKSDATVLGRRLLLPAWAGTAVVVVAVAAGVRGLGVLAAYGLAGFAFSANLRQLLLAMGAARRHGARRWRGLVGRANGGMVVHLGVVVIAVALASAVSFAQRSQVTLRPGRSATVDGQRITYLSLAQVRGRASSATQALVLVNGHGPMRPAVSQFGAGTQPVGTPAIDSSPWRDVYLTIDSLPATVHGPVGIGVTVQPLVSWLWVGGATVALGAVLAMVPGRRRRPTDPVSAPPEVGGRRRRPGPTPGDGDGAGPGGAASGEGAPPEGSAPDRAPRPAVPVAP